MVRVETALCFLLLTSCGGDGGESGQSTPIETPTAEFNIISPEVDTGWPVDTDASSETEDTDAGDSDAADTDTDTDAGDSDAADTDTDTDVGDTDAADTDTDTDTDTDAG